MDLPDTRRVRALCLMSGRALAFRFRHRTRVRDAPFELGRTGRFPRERSSLVLRRDSWSGLCGRCLPAREGWAIEPGWLNAGCLSDRGNLRLGSVGGPLLGNMPGHPLRRGLESVQRMDGRQPSLRAASRSGAVDESSGAISNYLPRGAWRGEHFSAAALIIVCGHDEPLEAQTVRMVGQRMKRPKALAQPSIAGQARANSR